MPASVIVRTDRAKNLRKCMGFLIVRGQLARSDVLLLARCRRRTVGRPPTAWSRPRTQWSAACPPAARAPRAATRTAEQCDGASSATRSFDHLVGAGEQRWRNFEAERPGRLQVDDELEFGGLQDREVCGLGALEDLTGVGADLTKHVRTIGRVAHQPTDFDNLTTGIGCDTGRRSTSPSR